MSDELPLEEKPRWTVEPVFQRETKKMRERKIKPELKHYELRYDGTCQDKATGETDVARLREAARFCNSRGLAPRPRTECIADLASRPIKPLKQSERSVTEPANITEFPAV